MDKLRAYLTGRRKGEFARQVDISPAYLSQILGGLRKPSLSLMRRIQSETMGLVDLNSWSFPTEFSSGLRDKPIDSVRQVKAAKNSGGRSK